MIDIFFINVLLCIIFLWIYMYCCMYVCFLFLYINTWMVELEWNTSFVYMYTIYRIVHCWVTCECHWLSLSLNPSRPLSGILMQWCIICIKHHAHSSTCVCIYIYVNLCVCVFVLCDVLLRVPKVRGNKGECVAMENESVCYMASCIGWGIFKFLWRVKKILCKSLLEICVEVEKLFWGWIDILCWI